MAAAVQQPAANESKGRYDRRLAEILACAARLFCDKGYDAASIRDLSRVSGIGLSGLYYYFKSKEELLYLIQKDAFETLISRAAASVSAAEDGPERLRALVASHVTYFLEQPERSKVLSHEDDTLRGPLSVEVAALKRSYYRMAKAVVEEVYREAGRTDANSRVAVLSLFGMMNWMYTWHNPRRDPGASALSEQIAAIFLQGVSIHSARRQERNGHRNQRQRVERKDGLRRTAAIG
jgi:TetR/AcrR family transcriptional regulator, cholesterol catabolism regulator